jgi:hypothetical protein
LPQRWQEQGEQAVASIVQWRVTHQKAKLAEIEQPVDEKINRLRDQLSGQGAQASAAANSEASQELVCEKCGQARHSGGRARQLWQTEGGHQAEVERTYVTCLKSGGGFFPWIMNCTCPDGHLLPYVQEALVRFRSELPFGRVAEHLEEILAVAVHASAARWKTLSAGQRVLQLQNEQALPLAVWAAGAGSGAHGDEQRWNHGARGWRSVGRVEGSGDWRG